MGFVGTLALAIALSMDAFSVSVCKGLSIREIQPKHLLAVGLYFGGFQALMPTIGYFLGVQFESLITNIDHWIAFILLGFIGMNMLRESFDKDIEKLDDSISVKTMLPLAIATSIDALAAGISLAVIGDGIAAAAWMIGLTTFCLSAIGIFVGNMFGAKYKSKAEFVGGIVLVCIGAKILLEHLNIISF